MRDNSDACRDAISEELGVKNWEEVNFSKDAELSARFDALAGKCAEAYEGSSSGCNKSGAQSFAIERMSINGKVFSIELTENNNTSWTATGSINTNYGKKIMMLGIICNNGSYDVSYARVL